MTSVNDNRKPATEATQTPLEAALAYAKADYPVLPLWWIAEPAPPEIVKAYLAGPKTKEAKKAASAHARCGCPDRDCRSPGKHPINANGASGATTDVDQIEAWFSEYPRANVGIRMPIGVVAIDDDRIEGAAERVADLPATLTQSSGLGSHRLYRGVPEGFAFASTLDGMPGIDLIHNGHRYLVAAPSTHWTGTQYKWLEGPGDESEIPSAVLARCARGVRAPSTTSTPSAASARRFGPIKIRFADHCPTGVAPKDWARVIATTMAPAISDEEEGSKEHGHVTLKRAAGSLIAGLGLDADYAVAVLWTHYNPRCVPPWGDDEREDFERTVRGAGVGLDAGYLLPKVAAEIAGTVDGLVFGELSSNPPKQSFLIPELEIGVGRPYGWLGKTNASKTLALMQLEVDLALGRPVFGQFAGPGKPVPVLRIAYEGFSKAPEDYLRLLRGTGAALDFEALNGRLRFAEGRKHLALGADTREWLLRVTEPFGGGVCVIDPLVAACRGLDENSVEIAQPIYDLESVSKANGVTFIVAHHFGHGAERSRGSSAIPGAFGASAAISKIDGNGHINHRLVHCEKQNRYGFQDFELVIKDTTDKGKPWVATKEAIRAHETSWAVRVESTLTIVPDTKAAALDESVQALESMVRDSAGGIGARQVRTALGRSGTDFTKLLTLAKQRGHVRQKPAYGNDSKAVTLEWLDVAEPPAVRTFGKFTVVK